MASTNTVWGIDIGRCALRALKLSSTNGELRLLAFDVIEYPKILTQPDVDSNLLIRNALEQFLGRHDVAGGAVAVSVPGQSGFTRFVKLPPVEEKQVPEIVRFEAEQQIPFNIEEVIWRWQAFRDPDSPDIEVGIFAMKRSDVWEVLGRFGEAGATVDVVQIAPLALYNFMVFDGQAAGDGATLLVDVGTDKTDLVVADSTRIWTRTLQLGGNNFTEALVKAFRLNFTKAERLKRTAATSKYARQIFQAMRPVFAELVQEVQRSIGYYTSLHRESRFRRVIGLGNGFCLPGLQKYLEQNLGVPTIRIDGYNKLAPSTAAGAPAFTENILSLAVAYGLALQGLGLTRIQTNLLPSESARRRRWASKRSWFAAAAAMILIAAAIAYGRSKINTGILKPQSQIGINEKTGLQVARDVVSRYDRLLSNFNRVQGQDKAQEDKIKQYREMLGYRDFMPTLTFLVSESVNKVARDQGLMNFANKDSLKKIPRPQRRVIVIDSFHAQYEPDLASLNDEALLIKYRRPTGEATVGRGPGVSGPRPVAGHGSGSAQRPTEEKLKPPAQRGFLVYLEGSTPKRGAEADWFISDVKKMVGDLARRFPSLEVIDSKVVDRQFGQPSLTSAGGVESSAHSADKINLDPLTGEYAGEDTRFVLGWKIAIKGDGLPKDTQDRTAGPTGGVR